ncbi:unnamed protein product, partial [Prorocentrum cordatum]
APDCLLASPPHRVLGAPASVDHQAPAMLAAALRRAAARAAAPAAQAAAKPAENPMALARTAPPSTSWSARPPAQSTIGSSTSTLSQWCSWSTQAPPCWTSEGTGLVILFLSLSISLSDFSAPTKLRSGRLLPPRGTRLPRCERIVSETVLLHDAVAERACLAGVPLLSVRTAGARRARTDRTVRGSGDYAQRGARRSEKGPPSVPSVPSCHLS